MKTGLIILAMGFVAFAVILICVGSIVTSTTQGAKWIEDLGKSEPDDDSPPPENPHD